MRLPFNAATIAAYCTTCLLLPSTPWNELLGANSESGAGHKVALVTAALSAGLAGVVPLQAMVPCTAWPAPPPWLRAHQLSLAMLLALVGMAAWPPMQRGGLWGLVMPLVQAGLVCALQGSFEWRVVWCGALAAAHAACLVAGGGPAALGSATCFQGDATDTAPCSGHKHDAPTAVVPASSMASLLLQVSTLVCTPWAARFFENLTSAGRQDGVCSSCGVDGSRCNAADHGSEAARSCATTSDDSDCRAVVCDRTLPAGKPPLSKRLQPVAAAWPWEPAVHMAALLALRVADMATWLAACAAAVALHGPNAQPGTQAARGLAVSLGLACGCLSVLVMETLAVCVWLVGRVSAEEWHPLQSGLAAAGISMVGKACLLLLAPPAEPQRHASDVAVLALAACGGVLVSALSLRGWGEGRTASAVALAVCGGCLGACASSPVAVPHACLLTLATLILLPLASCHVWEHGAANEPPCEDPHTSSKPSKGDPPAWPSKLGDSCEGFETGRVPSWQLPARAGAASEDGGASELLPLVDEQRQQLLAALQAAVDQDARTYDAFVRMAVEIQARKRQQRVTAAEGDKAAEMALLRTQGDTSRTPSSTTTAATSLRPASPPPQAAAAHPEGAPVAASPAHTPPQQPHDQAPASEAPAAMAGGDCSITSGAVSPAPSASPVPAATPAAAPATPRATPVTSPRQDSHDSLPSACLVGDHALYLSTASMGGNAVHRGCPHSSGGGVLPPGASRARVDADVGTLDGDLCRRRGGGLGLAGSARVRHSSTPGAVPPHDSGNDGPGGLPSVASCPMPSSGTAVHSKPVPTASDDVLDMPPASVTPRQPPMSLWELHSGRQASPLRQPRATSAPQLFQRGPYSRQQGPGPGWDLTSTSDWAAAMGDAPGSSADGAAPRPRSNLLAAMLLAGLTDSPELQPAQSAQTLLLSTRSAGCGGGGAGDGGSGAAGGVGRGALVSRSSTASRQSALASIPEGLPLRSGLRARSWVLPTALGMGHAGMGVLPPGGVMGGPGVSAAAAAAAAAARTTNPMAPSDEAPLQVVTEGTPPRSASPFAAVARAQLLIGAGHDEPEPIISPPPPPDSRPRSVTLGWLPPEPPGPLVPARQASSAWHPVSVSAGPTPAGDALEPGETVVAVFLDK